MGNSPGNALNSSTSGLPPGASPYQPATDPSAAPPPKTGFWGILKNKVLPMVGPVTARLGAAFGNPEGLQLEYQNRALARQAAFDEPALQMQRQEAGEFAEEEPLRLQQLKYQTSAMDPQQQLRMQAASRAQEIGMTPTTGAGPSGEPMTGTIGIDPSTNRPSSFSPIPINNPPAAQPNPNTPPSAIAAASQNIAPGVPPPVNAAAGPAPSSQFLRPWMGGSKQQGKAEPDPEHPGQWRAPEYYVTPYGMQTVGYAPAQPPADIIAPKDLVPYLPQGVNLQNATQPQLFAAQQALLRDRAAAQNTTTTSQTNKVMQTDQGIVTIPETNVTTRTRGNAGAASAPPTSVTPGNATQGAPAPINRAISPSSPRAGVGVAQPVQSSSGGQLQGKTPQSVVKAEGDYNSAIQRQQTMDQNLKDALTGNQQAMLSLLTNHVGMTQGAQKGARITQAILNEAQASAPWLKIIGSKWDSNGYLSGVTLPPESMQQMVALAHQMVQAKREEYGREITAAKSNYGMGSNVPAPISNVSSPTNQPGQIHFTPIK